MKLVFDTSEDGTLSPSSASKHVSDLDFIPRNHNPDNLKPTRDRPPPLSQHSDLWAEPAPLDS